MLQFCIWFTLFTASIDSLNNQRNLTNILLLASENNFAFNEVTVVYGDLKRSNSIISNFLTRFNGQVMTWNANKRKIPKSTQFIVFIDRHIQIRSFFGNMNPYQKEPMKMIVVSDTKILNKKEVEHIFVACWNYQTADVIFMQSENERVVTYTFYPFNGFSCGNTSSVMTYIDNEEQLTSLFPSKYHNLRRCPIVATLVNFTMYVVLNKNQKGEYYIKDGIEGQLLTEIVNRMNGTLKITVPSIDGGYGSNKNGKWNGPFGDLVYGMANISATSAVLTYERFQVTQASKCYKSFEIVWITRNPPLLRIWLKILLPFWSSTFLFSFFSMLLIAIASAAYTAFSKRRKITKYKSSKCMMISILWAMFIGQPVSSRRLFSLPVILIIAWTWFCFVVRIVCQSMLVDVFTHQVFEDKFDNLTAGINFLKRYGGFSTLRNFLSDDQWLLENFIDVSNDQVMELIEAISKGEEFILATDLFSVLASGKAVQILPEPFVIAPVPIYVQPRNALRILIDDILSRMVETGLYNKLERNYWMKHRINKTLKLNNGSQPITMEMISGCFVLFGACTMFCLIVFLFEIFIARIKMLCCLKH